MISAEKRDLLPFTVEWAAPGATGFNTGARRVFARSERWARSLAPALISKDAGIPEASIVVLRVTLQEQCP